MLRIGAKDLRERQAEMLDTVQREPVTVERNGRPVAVLYSYQEAKAMEKDRLEFLKAKIAAADQSIEQGRYESFDVAALDRIKAAGRARLETKNAE